MGVMASLLGFGGGGGFIFDQDEGAYRDVLYLGDTDDGVRELAQLLGWEEELHALMGDDSSSSTSSQQKQVDGGHQGGSTNQKSSCSSSSSSSSGAAGKL